MSKFQKEFDQRLRRVCGITDDTKRVRYDEDIDPGHQTCFQCYPDDYGSFDYGPEYKVRVTVYEERGTYQTVGIAEKVFDGLADLMRALDEVEL